MSTEQKPLDVTEFIPGTTWIYGDSYGIVHNDGWTGLLAKNRLAGQINNRCQGGTGVPDAYYELMKDLRTSQIARGDRAILVLSDKHRVFRNNVTNMRNRLWGDNDSIKLNNLLYNACIRDAVSELSKHRVKTLIVWSFPSNYPGDSDLFNGHVGLAPWNEEFAAIDVDDYGYFWGADHVDQIRPALFHYSLLERSYNVMHADRRPNHIDDRAVHQKLLVATTDWILGKWHGVRDLRKDAVQSWDDINDQYGLNEISIRLDSSAIEQRKKNQFNIFQTGDARPGDPSQQFNAKHALDPRPLFKKWKPKRDKGSSTQ